MWRIRRTSWNKLSKGTVSVCQSPPTPPPDVCICMNPKFWLYTLDCLDCVCICRYGLSLANLHKHMHAFSSESLSTNYRRNLHARRFPSPLEAARQAAPRTSFLDWHSHLPDSLPLSSSSLYPWHLFCIQCQPKSGIGQLIPAWK